MEVAVKGRNILVTEALERYAWEKVERVSKFFDDERSASRAEVELTHERNPSVSEPEVAEATLFINGTVLKAREASEDMYASIDRMSDKLERQVRDEAYERRGGGAADGALRPRLLRLHERRYGRNKCGIPAS
jgi:putative sigma-54 modulation protein